MINGNFEDLERRCKRLKRKLYFKIFLSLFFILLLGSAYYRYFINKIPIFPDITKKSISKSIQKEKINPPHNSMTKIEEKKTAVSKSEFNSTIIPKNTKSKKSDITKVTQIKSKVNITDKNSSLKEDEKKIAYDTIFLHPVIEISEDKKESKSKVIKTKKPLLKKEDSPKIAKIETKKRNKSLNIKVRSMKKEQILLQNSFENDSYKSFIDLARYYFKNKNYKKAIYYAKKASRKSSAEKEPWLIYIKSKINLGKTDEARRVLKTFLTYFRSKEAEELLRNLGSKK